MNVQLEEMEATLLAAINAKGAIMTSVSTSLVSAANAVDLSAAINAFYVANPTFSFVSLSYVYDATAVGSEHKALLTYVEP
jgi:hypothetical protein